MDKATSLQKISLFRDWMKGGLFILYEKIKIQILSDLDKFMQENC